MFLILYYLQNLHDGINELQTDLCVDIFTVKFEMENLYILAQIALIIRLRFKSQSRKPTCAIAYLLFFVKLWKFPDFNF